MGIQFQSVTLTYGFSPVIEDFSFVVNKGQNACLQGISGSGKTSILRTVMGFMAPTGGEVQIGNHILSPDTRHDIRQQIAWLPQTLIMPTDTAQQMINLLMPQIDVDSLQDRLHQYLDALNLKPRLLTKDRLDLSQGQKQRLLLAILLLFRRPILLLDEPTSALDRGNADRVADLIFSLEETTVLTATHSPEWMERCNPVVQLPAQ